MSFMSETMSSYILDSLSWGDRNRTILDTGFSNAATLRGLRLPHMDTTTLAAAQAQMKDLLAPLLSALALGFTLFSFWWMNWRAGKLKVGNLHHFAAGKSTVSPGDKPNTLLICLPLVVINSGASPVVLESLRLISPSHELGTLLYQSVDEPLWPADDTAKWEHDYFFLPTVIRPNDVLQKNFVFSSGICERDFASQRYNLHLEAKITGQRDWQRLKHIELDLREQGGFSLYMLNFGYRIYPFRGGERA